MAGNRTAKAHLAGKVQFLKLNFYTSYPFITTHMAKLLTIMPIFFSMPPTGEMNLC